MTEKEKYMSWDSLAKMAISECQHVQKQDWLRKYADLYNQILYGPPGLPKIVSCNYDGVHYVNIERFWNTYTKKLGT